MSTSKIRFKSWVYGLRWKWAKKRFGIWGVRDYYCHIEKMANEGSQFTFGYTLMIFASAYPGVVSKQHSAAIRNREIRHL